MMLTATGHNTQLSPNIKRTLPPVRAAWRPPRGRHSRPRRQRRRAGYQWI